mmetsp:Transcript_104700/g.180561  ORF Transcript_104700/g.180561 Transcript_104700/m.180561 type:complete len:153 (+) Transcript_104700:81-539(+)
MFNVAIHLRRLDVYSPVQSKMVRVHHDDFFEKVLAQLEPLLPKNAQLYVLSAAYHKAKHLLIQQIRNKFPRAQLLVNTPASATFHAFVEADVLVMDLSRYSHLAGLFSQNIKISSPFRYNTSCDSSWVPVSDDGVLDVVAFKHALQELLRRK